MSEFCGDASLQTSRRACLLPRGHGIPHRDRRGEWPHALSWNEWARMVARDSGLYVDEDEADYALWEQTPFPCSDHRETTRALRRFFVAEESRDV